MNTTDYNIIFRDLKDKIISRLDNELKPDLYYHNSSHTLDVLEQVEVIAGFEGISDPAELFILRTAALFHDTGFLFVYQLHEEKSCEFMMEELKAYNLDKDILERITSLIMMTKLPPNPYGNLECIICDADLDYLGREDFFKISDSLRDEFIKYGIVKNDREWQEKQIKFFEFHAFFTLSSQTRRNQKKQQILRLLKKKFESDNSSQ